MEGKSLGISCLCAIENCSDCQQKLPDLGDGYSYYGLYFCHVTAYSRISVIGLFVWSSQASSSSDSQIYNSKQSAQESWNCHCFDQSSWKMKKWQFLDVPPDCTCAFVMLNIGIVSVIISVASHHYQRQKLDVVIIEWVVWELSICIVSMLIFTESGLLFCLCQK